MCFPCVPQTWNVWDLMSLIPQRASFITDFLKIQRNGGASSYFVKEQSENLNRTSPREIPWILSCCGVPSSLWLKEKTAEGVRAAGGRGGVGGGDGAGGVCSQNPEAQLKSAWVVNAQPFHILLPLEQISGQGPCLPLMCVLARCLLLLGIGLWLLWCL